MNDASKNNINKKGKRGGFIMAMNKFMECGKDISDKANDKKIVTAEQDFEHEDNE